MSHPSKRMHILILDQGRQALPIMRALKQARHHVTIVCGHKLSEGYFSRYADCRLIWPDYFHDPGGFTERLFDYVKRNSPDATLALGDISVGIVARNKPALTRYTKVAVPDEDIWEQAADKGKTMGFCMAHDIPCPISYLPDEEDLENIIAKASFPVMVKPRRGIGAIGLHKIDTPQDLRRHYRTLKERFGELIIQEFIPLEGGQYQAEAFLDTDSRMKVCMVISKPRFFPVTGGTSTANMTIHRPDIQENVRRLLEGIHWMGAADVDLIHDPRDNTPKILEINPRVTAGIKIGFAAGINYADLQIRLINGQPIPEVKSYKIGVYSRNMCMDILWYLFSDQQTRKSTPLPFFKFIGKDVCYQNYCVDDPLPLIGFTLGMMKKYVNPKVWKTKLGRDL
ncbi:MAG: ATP-grasp domain-containing protein [Planctomycetota bacterium]|nr:MAG: ATP-grasp domain-containing protein [Planctomycetota bacterium]